MVKSEVALAKEEHDVFMTIIGKGSHSSQRFRIAYILLNRDEGECQFRPGLERRKGKVTENEVASGATPGIIICSKPSPLTFPAGNQ